MKHHTLADFGMTESSLKLMLVLFFVVGVCSLFIALIFYFIKAFGVYNQSKSLNIKNASLAFVPFANIYALGRVSAVYETKKGKHFNGAGKILVFFGVLCSLFALIFAVMSGICAIDVLYNIDAAVSVDAEITKEVLSPTDNLLLPSVLLLIALLIYKIIRTAVLWRVYVMFAKSGAAAMTVFSFIFPVLIPIFLYAIRKNTPVTSYEERNDNSNFSAFNYGAP